MVTTIGSAAVAATVAETIAATVAGCDDAVTVIYADTCWSRCNLWL